MSELVDRFMILLMAVVTLGSMLVGWIGGYVLPAFSGWGETVGMATLIVLVVVLLIGLWFEFNRIDTRRA